MYEHSSSWRLNKALCLDRNNPNLYLLGTKDSLIRDVNFSYFIMNYGRCSNATRLPNDPPCATNSEIDEWAIGKSVQILGLSHDVDFDIENEESFNERYHYIANV